MVTLTPSIQEEVDATQVVGGSVVAPPPLIQGPAPAIWAGLVGGFIVFLLVMIFIIRGRVIRPAQQKAFEPKADFFEPAGKDADITFEDPPQEEVKPKKRGWFSRKPKPAPEPEAPVEDYTTDEAAYDDEAYDVSPTDIEDHHSSAELEPADAFFEDDNPHETSAHDHDRVIDVEVEDPLPDPTPEPENTVAPEAKKKQNRSPFAGLFKSKRKEKEAAAHETPAEAPYDTPANDEASISILPADGFPDDIEDNSHDVAQADFPPLPEEEPEQSAPPPEAHPDSASAEDIADEPPIEDAFAEAESRRRADALAFAAREQANEEARSAAASAEAARLLNAQPESADASFDAKLAALSEKIDEQLAMRPAQTDAGAVAAQVDSHLAGLIEKQFASLKQSLDASIDDLQRQVSAAPAPERSDDVAAEIADLKRLLSAQASVATGDAVPLSEVIRTALPQSAYTFEKQLTNGHIADCIVTLPQEQGDIAIVGRFPALEFENFIRDQNTEDHAQQTENAFRRAFLDHLSHISKHFISPGETTSSALMFVPSDSILHEIQTRFPDLVQESYDGRVWMASPSSLAATLHTIRDLLRNTPAPDKPASNSPNNGLKREVAELRARVDALETYIEASRGGVTTNTAPPLVAPGVGAQPPRPRPAAPPASAGGAPSLSAEEEAFERLEREEALREARERAETQSLSRPPFPLR